ncbi:NADH dehydrogenase [ubiquinone] 1 alpha subcomplex subunit 6 [Sporobolomyces koalae]|uniref:NADH dehydrogenase [ubiquinone] 1 alpha subcomplex subunit 6 n=1 Tax=Sporobolomyces koalae TaxID=500713 RepID=UPI00317AE072
MTTIPARLARLTTSSGSWPVAQARSRSLYRQWYRSAPEIVQLYALNIPAYTIRAKVRELFEKNSNVSDPEAVDVLLLKGYQDFQETINCWKMESHVLRMFADEELPARPNTFLESFYLSRDDAKEVIPTA